jgi:hypothetical protein
VSEITPPTFSEEGQRRFLQQAFSLWILPEIQRRTDEGALPPNFQLLAAQIVFWPDGRPLEVRFNTEVRCTFVVEPTADLIAEVDKLIGLDEINRIVEIHPPVEEADAGHVTILRLRDSWSFTFDFTYNNARVAQTLKAAEDFLFTAHAAAKQRRYRPFIDALFSAVELMAKALLLSAPGRDALEWNHKKIAVRLNLRRKGNVIGGAFAPLLNDLAELRRSARYSCDDFRIEPDEVQRLRNRANEMLELVGQQIARRARQLVPVQLQ